jgi:hypothetical protein
MPRRTKSECRSGWGYSHYPLKASTIRSGAGLSAAVPDRVGSLPRGELPEFPQPVMTLLAGCPKSSSVIESKHPACF